ncbi:NADH-quinone oxidoreductase subunit A [Desulfofalx alkaliphila]|uniref:NADH-quinone oxidoreductase subunit A n=1 Tax=Desulfofalx alkaliphila TaxID=105483 RepID=UPI0004E13CF8|nr:NADH-quinone oxidoreductase subunit A [Desulfofalx alkaliphila]
MLSVGGAIFIFLVVGIIFGIGGIVTAFLIQPRRKNSVKEETYECGPPTQGTAWVRFKVQYFVYALLFVTFDVATIYLYPWAVRFSGAGMFEFLAMVLFFAIVVLGLAYAWKEGALEWK